MSPRAKSKIPVPTEEQEQIALFQWAEVNQYRYPALRWLHAIPNGGLRNRVVAAKLKRAGVKPGVSDVFLPAATARYHGLYIEMKRVDGVPSDTSKDQRQFIADMREQGYACRVCYGWEMAADTIKHYLAGGETC